MCLLTIPTSTLWPACLGIGLLALAGTGLAAHPLDEHPVVVAAQDAASMAVEEKEPERPATPEERMNRRFPQKVKVGDLIGLPVLDDNDVTLGHVTQVVRSPEGKIKLIVSYSKWFGWWGRPVAVPIEVVAILARQIASLDMAPQEYEAAPTWAGTDDRPIPDGEIIRIAITRR